MKTLLWHNKSTNFYQKNIKNKAVNTAIVMPPLRVGGSPTLQKHAQSLLQHAHAGEGMYYPFATATGRRR
jgi:hypothetical protein